MKGMNQKKKLSFWMRKWLSWKSNPKIFSQGSRQKRSHVTSIDLKMRNKKEKDFEEKREKEMEGKWKGPEKKKEEDGHRRK